MAELQDFKAEGEFAAFRPSGDVLLHQALAMVGLAIRLSREQHVKKLLVDTSGWTGLRSPTVADRFFFVNEWAEAASGMVQVAVVARSELIDSQRFGVTVARNYGLRANVFLSEQEALDWLGVKADPGAGRGADA